MNNGFAGSIKLFNTINISELKKELELELKMENESIEYEEVVYKEILNAIKNVVNKCIDSIEIPVYIMHHDDLECINVKTGEVKKLGEF